MPQIEFRPRRRSEPLVPAPPDDRRHLLDATGAELVEAVVAWFEAAGYRADRDPLTIADVPVHVMEGGPVHGYHPGMLAVAGERLVVVVVSPFPGAERTALHTVTPHPDLAAAARRSGVRITRAWDLVHGDARFARQLLADGDAGFVAVDTAP